MRVRPRWSIYGNERRRDVPPPPDEAGPNLLTGLVSWWPMQEDTGNSRVDVHGSNDFLESTTPVSRAGGIIDTYSAYFQRAGTNNALRLPAGGTLEFHNAFTLMMWANFEDFAIASYLMGKSIAECRVLVFGTTGLIRLDVQSTNQVYYGPNLSVATDYMILVVYDPAGDLGISINGDPLTASNTDPVERTIPEGSNDFWFGQDTSGFPYKGLGGPCAFWNRILTDDEIAWLYNSGAGRLYGDL